MRGHRWIAPGAAAATSLLAVWALLLGSDSRRPPAGRPHGVPGHQPPPRIIPAAGGAELFDASDLGRVAVLPEAMGRPVAARYLEREFWLFDRSSRSFVAIDPATGAVVRRLRSPITDVGFFTAEGRMMWITDEADGVTAIDIRDGHVLRRFARLPGAGGSEGVVVDAGSLWVARPAADNGNGLLVRLDPRTGAVRQPIIRGQPGTYALATAAGGAIWTAGTFGNINRIDPATGAVARGVTEGRNFDVAAGGGYGWTADSLHGVVYQVNERGEVVTQYPTAPGARALSYADGALWVANGPRGTATRIAAGHTTTLRFDRHVRALVAGAGVVLIAFGAPLPAR
jgi:hypothetical protein